MPISGLFLQQLSCLQLAEKVVSTNHLEQLLVLLSDLTRQLKENPNQVPVLSCSPTHKSKVIRYHDIRFFRYENRHDAVSDVHCVFLVV